MARVLSDNLSYEEWIEHVFNHPIVDPQWWFHIDDEYAEEWDEAANPARTLAYLTELFRRPGFLIPRFSRAQIDQGLDYLVSPSCSNHMFLLCDEALPLADRLACIDAMKTLYSDLMAPVYGDDLGHTRTGPGDPQRPIVSCYMWWDVIPLSGGRFSPLSDACLDVFTKTLELRSEACLESVLHGLGHWGMDMPERTEPIVRAFLARRTDLSPALRHYAEQAAEGYVQ